MANPKSKKRKKTILFSAILLVIVALALVAIFKKKEAVITVQSEKVVRRSLTELVVANGKIQPVVQVTLSPEVSGEIIELPVKEGQSVKKGDLLVKIKPDPYIASRNSAEANYKYSMALKNSSEASLEKADFEFKREDELFKHKLISESDRQTAKTGYDVAVATLLGAVQQVEMAQAALAKADDDLSKTTIYSPINGTVTKLYSQAGERVVGTATMAGTDIMIVSDLNEMEARVDIGEVDVVLIKPGQNARLEVDSFKDRKFKGVVTEVADSAKNNVTGTAAAAASSSSSTQDATKFEVKIRIAEKEEFRPGMSVTAEIETRSRTNVLTVPIQSVTTRLPKEPAAGKGNATNNAATNSTAVAANDPPASNATNEVKSGDRKKAGELPKPKEVVFVIQGERAKMTPVKRGIADDDYVEIVEGLNEGQDVVSGGSKAINRDLEDDKKVVIGPAKTDAAPVGK
jgi:HlyD family secretion protein